MANYRAHSLFKALFTLSITVTVTLTHGTFDLFDGCCEWAAYPFSHQCHSSFTPSVSINAESMLGTETFFVVVRLQDVRKRRLSTIAEQAIMKGTYIYNVSVMSWSGRVVYSTMLAARMVVGSGPKPPPMLADTSAGMWIKKRSC